jgi:hypothetical protein
MIFAALAAACLGFAGPAQAQIDPGDAAALAELDPLTDAVDPGSGMTQARQQIGDGDLVGAVATLERVLMFYPEADPALVLHASLLCRLDDRDGARAELGELRGRTIPNQAWAEVTAACGPMPRPAARGH